MNYPNHTVTAILTDSRGIRARTGKIKFYADPQASQENKETAAREEVERHFCRSKSRNPSTVTSLTLAKLAPPKLGAKLNEQREYITLRATFLDGTLSFTTSYRGISVAGDFIHDKIASDLIQLVSQLEKTDNRKAGERMHWLCELAKASKTLQEFWDKVRTPTITTLPA